ncbi:MAG: hypothetical protein IKZ60_00220 [Bacteroidales bacterium]|nr:hypothetical protein [Bacteroidales bacterium]
MLENISSKKYDPNIGTTRHANASQHKDFLGTVIPLSTVIPSEAKESI